MIIDFLLNWGLFFSLGLFAIGALASVIADMLQRQKIASLAAHSLAAFGGLMGAAFSIAVLLSGETVMVAGSFDVGIATNIIALRIDLLAAFFIGVISLVTIAASIFGIGYQKHYIGRYRLGSFGAFYNLFLASMFLVVSADNALLFLFAWEVMSIASYFLVVFEWRNNANVRAGVLYILMTQVGTAFLFAAFLLMYSVSHSWDFEAIRSTLGSAPALFQNAIFGLALIGFATKSGVIPLHIWLPEAHPAAPSHVSALMSGVMLKTAIYMIIRFSFEIFPAASFSWGIIIVSLGAISSLLGVLYALSEHDIKRLLAFHSVENIGIILLGIGASITFFSYGLPIAGVLALAAALYHTINHALFKGLLFLSAGSVVHATGTRNMEEYGGLIRHMPVTAFFFLIGAIAISGLPPLNGFVSEWFTFQSLFLGLMSLPIMPKIVFLVGAASLAVTGGLAAACFVKAFGTIFLARERGHSKPEESEVTMRVGMGLLAALCILFGLFATTIAPILAHTAASLTHMRSGAIPFTAPTKTISIDSFSSLSIVYVAGAFLVSVLATYLFISLATRRRTVVVGRTWDCGSDLTPRMEITATGFARSIITVFQGVLRPTSQTDIEYEDASFRYFATKTVRMSLPDLYKTYLYGPVSYLLERSATETKRLQTGNLSTYLLYMSLTLVALLMWAFT